MSEKKIFEKKIKSSVLFSQNITKLKKKKKKHGTRKRYRVEKILLQNYVYYYLICIHIRWIQKDESKNKLNILE